MRLLTAFCLTGLCASAFGVEVTNIQGKVYFNGKAVSRGQKITESGELSTGPASKAVVLLSDADGKNEIALAADSRCRIEAGDPSKEHSLLAGSLRARLRDKVNKTKFRARTHSAVMAVRGTDFMAVYGPLLSESEIVVFEGTVAFTNAADETDTKDIPRGHWGGVGGRFGKKIGEIITLPPHILKEFDEKSRF